MAEGFAFDPQEAEAVARELTRLHSDMRTSPGPLDSTQSIASSPPVQAAMNDFLRATAETHAGLLASVGQVRDLFIELVEGTLDLDKALAVRSSDR